MRVNDRLIEPAIKAIEDLGIAEKGIVPNEFKGYIDTFAASIVQNGLIPAVIFFESGGDSEEKSGDKEKENTQKNRRKMLRVILSLVQQAGGGVAADEHSTLFDYIKSRESDLKKTIRQDIVDAALAFKLALRTFKYKKNE